ncbi:hypothetical protein N2152v2_003911 [Parachlorella kessleri]
MAGIAVEPEAVATAVDWCESRERQSSPRGVLSRSESFFSLGTSTPDHQPASLPDSAASQQLSEPTTCQAAFTTPEPLHYPAAQLYSCQPVQQSELLTGIHGVYQPYCTQVITDSTNETAMQLLLKLRALQAYEADLAAFQGLPPSKRYFCSLKEACKKVGEVKLLLVAPDIKHAPTAGSDPIKMLRELLLSAYSQGVPVVFVLSRSAMGQAFSVADWPQKHISVLAVTKTHGCETEILSLLEQAQQGIVLHNLCRGF